MTNKDDDIMEGLTKRIAPDDMGRLNRDFMETMRSEQRHWACSSLRPVKPGELDSLERWMENIILEEIPMQLRLGLDEGYFSGSCQSRIEAYKQYYPYADFEGFRLRNRGDPPYYAALERLGQPKCATFAGNELDEELVREGVIGQLAAKVAAETRFWPAAFLMGSPHRANNGATIVRVQFYHNEIYANLDVRIA